MQSSPYLQQHFYFVSEHGLNRHRVRISDSREVASLKGRVPRAISTVRERELVESYERFAYKWFRHARHTIGTQDIKYRTRKEMTEALRRDRNERGMILRGFIDSILSGTV